jgi:hypothetical protein
MTGVAFDVLIDTEILVSPLPIWEEEWAAHPEACSNPAKPFDIMRHGWMLGADELRGSRPVLGLLENIRRDGIVL